MTDGGLAFDYEFRNFKAFASSGPIILRPITLVYGPNSSGKSSLLQSLLLLKQTLDEAENPETLLLPKGNLVDLGGYREFIYRHDPELPFSIQFVRPVDPRQSRGESFGEIPSSIAIAELGIRITFRYDETAANASVEEYEFFVDDNKQPVCSFRLISAEEAEQLQGKGRLPFRVGRVGRVYRGDSINQNHPFWRRLVEAEQQALARYSQTDLRANLQAFKKELSKIERLENTAAKADVDPKRRRRKLPHPKPAMPDKQVLVDQIRAFEEQLRMIERPVDEVVATLGERHRRTYFVARNFLPGEAEVLPATPEGEGMRRRLLFGYGADGPGFAQRVYGQAGQLLRQFLGDLVYLGPLRESPERHYVFSGNVTRQVGKTGRLVPDVLFKNRDLLTEVNDQLAGFNIGYELVVSGSPSGELNDVFSIRLIDRATKVNASILDVGFGISQVLPVVVQSMLSRGKTLCIEQPEIHLHPRLQAELGSLLVTCTRKPYNNRFIVETHSQHLMLRLQRLIRQKKLSHQELSVIYVDKDSNGSRCLQLRLDEDGEFIDEWPQGFFEEGYQEIFAR